MLLGSEKALGDRLALGIFLSNPCIPLLFLLPSFVATTTFYCYFGESIARGSEGPQVVEMA